jgi:GH24 family phage-related lysozyme (muramidase)
MWRDYIGLLPATAAIINGFIAVVVAQFAAPAPHPFPLPLMLHLVGGHMSGSDIETTDQQEFEQARGDREGLAWFRDQAGVEAVSPSGAPSTTPISPRAFNLIVEFEVSGQNAYSQLYHLPIWPQGASGVTIGIGYDVGYVSKDPLWSDWKGAIPDAMISTLERALGVTGLPAKELAQDLRAVVDVPWPAAISVHSTKVIPLWVGLVERSLPNAKELGSDCLGALVSLTYNRGASFDRDGDLYTEMRAIKACMQNEECEQIPDQFRSMKRLWPTVRGLQNRRERETTLFEAGLA